MVYTMIGQVGGKPVLLTQHANQRAKDRGVTHDEILETLRAPSVTYPGKTSGGQKIRCKLANGKEIFLVKVEEERGIVVITVGQA